MLRSIGVWGETPCLRHSSSYVQPFHPETFLRALRKNLFFEFRFFIFLQNFGLAFRLGYAPQPQVVSSLDVGYAFRLSVVCNFGYLFNDPIKKFLQPIEETEFCRYANAVLPVRINIYLGKVSLQHWPFFCSVSRHFLFVINTKLDPKFSVD